MPYLGAHMSVSGGLARCFERIISVQGTSLQIFSRNQRQWQAPNLSDKEIELFRAARSEWGVENPIAVHNSYLINLAAINPEIETKSIAAQIDEIERAAALEIPYLVLHPGNHLGEGVEAGIAKVAANLDKCIESAKDSEKVKILLETTAGQGTCIGSRFEEIAAIINRSKYSGQIGVCFDTCHVLAAGYDIAAPKGYGETFDEFDKTIGLDKLFFFHINDSKKGVGSKLDRHEHIGKGEVGLKGFSLLLNDPRFASHPMVLETPKSEDLHEDKENLKTLRGLLKKAG